MKSLATAFAVLVAACGGGGGSGPSEPQAQAVALPLVVLYGDSVQRGDAAGGVNVATEAQRLLPDIVLQQQGVNGSYAENLLDGPPKWSEVLKSSPAKVVSFNYGINDFYSLEEYRWYLTRLVQDAQAAGKVVILQTPNAITGPMQGGDMALRAQVGREVAQATGAVLCDQYANGLAKGMLAETADGVHPNAVQLRVMGALFAGCVRRAGM